MASRNRNRPNIKEEADEERNIWHQIRSDSKRIDSYFAESNARWARMNEIKGLLESQHASSADTSSELEEELTSLTRQNIKSYDEIQSQLSGTSDGDVNSLLGQLNLLAALRASSEADSHQSLPMSRAASSSKPSRNAKRKNDAASIMSAEDRESLAADSPAAPSPKVHVPAATRFKVHASGSRASSVPAGREASVKIEDGAESGVEVAKESSRPQKYAVGMEILYRNRRPNKDKEAEGEGILCLVHAVIGDGKQRRYEIRDADPDVPAVPYRASLQQMTPIPPNGVTLPSLQPGRAVLAMYPNTTTFYKAEVVPRKMGGEADGEATPKGFVRLKFEGEEEFDKEQEVERRYVLTDWTGK